MSSERMSSEEAAAYLGTTSQALRHLRARKRGPAYHAVPAGQSVRCVYLRADLDAYRDRLGTRVEPEQAADPVRVGPIHEQGAEA